jgi:hypothetical protein
MSGTTPASDLRAIPSATLDGAVTIEAAPGYALSAAESAYKARLDALHAALAKQMPKDGEELQAEKLAAIDRARRRLKEGVEAVLAAPAGAERDRIAEQQRLRSHAIEGFHEQWMLRLRSVPFTVWLLVDGERRPLSDAKGQAQDILIAVRDVHLPPLRQRLKAEIDRTAIVVKAVFEERARKDETVWEMALGRDRRREARMKLDLHLRRLAGIASVGLTNVDDSQVGFAEQSLTAFKEEFVALEAGGVKNGYIRRLGFFALLGFAASAAGYALWPQLGGPDWVGGMRDIFLLGAGASLGAWLSFSIRRVTLNFGDLALLEEDRLNPGLRILFVLALTAVIGLMLETKAFSFTMGGFTANEMTTGAGGLLIGVLAGIAERAVATAIGKRAQDFGTALGGSGTTQR